MDRRRFLTSSGLTALAAGMPAAGLSLGTGRQPVDYTIRIGTALLEVGPQRFLSMTAYNGQLVPASVDGAAEERTPYIPAHGMRRDRFVPGPSGFRFYHTHVRAGSDLHLGQYGGEVGPVYIEPAHDPGAYDREVSVLWLGAAERVSALVEMDHPGVWVLHHHAGR